MSRPPLPGGALAQSGAQAGAYTNVPPAAAADPLKPRALASSQSWNGVVQTADGRLFVSFPRILNAAGPSLAVVGSDNGLTPYPDAAWNTVPATDKKTPADAATDPGPSFISIDAIRLAPDGAIWAVDAGLPGFGKPAVPGGARLVRIDLATNMVTRVLTLPAAVLQPKSMIGDIRFNGDQAYVTDAGAPGLIVLDLKSGQFRRVLDKDRALTAQRPIMVDGETMRGPDGKPVMIHADRIEVTPDGGFLYIQPLCGPMSRIPTALLNDPRVPPATLSGAVEFWYDTPAVGGTAIAPDGTLYLNDVEHDRVLSLSPDRVLSVLLQDPRLHWADAPFLAPNGTLLLPVSQLDRAAPFHHGHSQIRFPVGLYSIRPADLKAPATPAPAPAASPH